MLAHNVFFWLKEGLSCEDIAAFREGLETLARIPAVEAIYVGAPAPVPVRPVIDNTFIFGLTVLFADIAAHDAYQEHPLHRAFLDRFGAFWDRVMVYDAQ
ncbi:MAG TPA: Dabb family protein [Candidatus Hydrogenedentes bacterium]|nr:Dabb family protein [Candidatus Hydrogenedentota bacterium]